MILNQSQAAYETYCRLFTGIVAEECSGHPRCLTPSEICMNRVVSYRFPVGYVNLC